MGTMIQEQKFEENDFRGSEFLNHSKNLQGNNDLLCITQPETIYNIHKVIVLFGFHDNHGVGIVWCAFVCW